MIAVPRAEVAPVLLGCARGVNFAPAQSTGGPGPVPIRACSDARPVVEEGVAAALQAPGVVVAADIAPSTATRARLLRTDPARHRREVPPLVCTT